MKNSISRRRFLGASAAAAAGIAFPTVIPSGVLADTGKPGANDRINIGFIGIGGRGMGHLKSWKNNAGAVCDVDKNHLGAAERVAGEKAGACEDYRRILDRKDIDAVLISTPDHWHAVMTVHACQAGKDVYCEKPASNTVREGRAMVNAAQRYQRVVQIGSQGRAHRASIAACEYIRNGNCGKVDKIVCWHPMNPEGNPPPDSAPPAELNWDLWLGPAAWRPYNRDRVHFFFRYFLDLGGGNIRDRGAHVFSQALWFMNCDHTGPVSIDASGTPPSKGLFDCPTKMEVTYKFKNPDWTLVWRQPGEHPKDYPSTNFGFKVFGDKDTLWFNGGDGGCAVQDKAYKFKAPVDGQVFHSPGHVENWLDCVKTREQPLTPIEAGHRIATMCILGNISYILGRPLQWDPVKETVIGDEAANRLAFRENRAPWIV